MLFKPFKNIFARHNITLWFKIACFDRAQLNTLPQRLGYILQTCVLLIFILIITAIITTIILIIATIILIIITIITTIISIIITAIITAATILVNCFLFRLLRLLRHAARNFLLAIL